MRASGPAGLRAAQPAEWTRSRRDVEPLRVTTARISAVAAPISRSRDTAAEQQLRVGWIDPRTQVMPSVHDLGAGDPRPGPQPRGQYCRPRPSTAAPRPVLQTRGPALETKTQYCSPKAQYHRSEAQYCSPRPILQAKAHYRSPKIHYHSPHVQCHRAVIQARHQEKHPGDQFGNTVREDVSSKLVISSAGCSSQSSLSGEGQRGTSQAPRALPSLLLH